MAVNREDYQSQESARKYLLSVSLASDAVKFLLESGKHGLSATELSEKIGHKRIGASSALLRVLFTAGVVKKSPKKGTLQPYVVDSVALFLLAKEISSREIRAVSSTIPKENEQFDKKLVHQARNAGYVDRPLIPEQKKELAAFKNYSLHAENDPFKMAFLNLLMGCFKSEMKSGKKHSLEYKLMFVYLLTMVTFNGQELLLASIKAHNDAQRQP